MIGVVELGAGAELQEATGVGGSDDGGQGGGGILHFVGQQFERCVGLRDIVDSRGAAADFGVRQFHKFEVGDGAQELARGVAYFLSVQEVAGVLIGDTDGDRLRRVRSFFRTGRRA